MTRLDPCPACGIEVGAPHMQARGTSVCADDGLPSPAPQPVHAEAAVDPGGRVVVLRVREGLGLPQTVRVPWSAWLRITSVMLAQMAGIVESEGGNGQ